MSLASPPVLRSSDFDNADPRLLAAITRALRQQHDAVAALPQRWFASGTFLSAASGTSTVLVLNALPTQPKHVTLALRREDLADFTAAWSWWPAIQSGIIKLSFVGLPASTKLVYSVEFF